MNALVLATSSPLIIVSIILLIILAYITMMQKRQNNGVDHTFYDIKHPTRTVSGSNDSNDFHEWALAQGSLGTVFTFVLLAGELLTTFTLLGHTGLVYSKGGAIFYITALDTFIFSYMYFVQPIIWHRQKTLHAVSQTDYFAKAFRSATLGKTVTIVAALALVPYIAIQISGVAIICSVLTKGAISTHAARTIAILFTIAYGIIGGIRGVAQLALVKDILLVFVIVVVGIYLPLHLYGSWPNILHTVEHQYPGFTTIHTPGNGFMWFLSTTMTCALGFAFWPHTFSSTFASVSPQALRKTQILSPLYCCVGVPLTMVGFTALLDDGGLPRAKHDQIFMRLAVHHLPSAMIIIIALGALLTAIIPSTVMTISLAANIIMTFTQDQKTIATKKRSTIMSTLRSTIAHKNLVVKLLVPIIISVATIASVYGQRSIQDLFISGYSIIGQLFVPFIVDLWHEKFPHNRKISPRAITSGLITGVTLSSSFTLCGISYPVLHHYLPDNVAQINIGIIAIIINICTVILVEKLFPDQRSTISQSH